MTSVTNQSLKGVSGIYAIQCVVNDRCYVGSAVDIRQRFWAHTRQLERGVHHSNKLQAAWNKYGADAFDMFVIEVVLQKELLIEREQFWIEQLEAFTSGYNCRPKAENHLGFQHSPETRAKMSAAHAGKKFSTESKARLSKARTGTRMHPRTRAAIMKANIGRKKTPEERARLSASHVGKSTTGRNARGSEHWKAVEFAVVSPDGKVYTGRNITEFARMHGLDERVMRNLVCGRTKSSFNGWRLAATPETISKCKNFAFVSPTGEVHAGKNVAAFARSQGLCPTSMRSVNRGNAMSHKGWRNLDQQKFQPSPARTRSYVLQSPEGQIYEGTNATLFAHENGIPKTCLFRLLDGDIVEYKGWRKADLKPLQLSLPLT